MPASVMKYLSIRSGSMPEKPRSIMRLTASGTASVAAAEITSAASSGREHPLVAQQIGPQAEQRAQARRAWQRLLPPPASMPDRGGRHRQLWGYELHK